MRLSQFEPNIKSSKLVCLFALSMGRGKVRVHHRARLQVQVSFIYFSNKLKFVHKLHDQLILSLYEINTMTKILTLCKSVLMINYLNYS